MTINKKKRNKKILLVGLGNLGSNYIKAIFSLPFNIELYIFDKKLRSIEQKILFTTKRKNYQIKKFVKIKYKS